jgi:hypothetical protein
MERVTITTDGGVYNRNGRAYADMAAVGNDGAMVYFRNTDSRADGTSMASTVGRKATCNTTKTEL